MPVLALTCLAATFCVPVCSHRHSVHAAAARLLDDFELMWRKANGKLDGDMQRRAAHNCSFCQGEMCMLCGDKCLRCVCPGRVAPYPARRAVGLQACALQGFSVCKGAPPPARTSRVCPHRWPRRFDAVTYGCDCCGEKIRRGMQFYRNGAGNRWCAKCVLNGGLHCIVGGCRPPPQPASRRDGPGRAAIGGAKGAACVCVCARARACLPRMSSTSRCVCFSGCPKCAVASARRATVILGACACARG